MTRLEQLEKKVHELYDAEYPHRAEWADWLAADHVFVVADNATELAERFGTDKELSRAGALLHDIADAKMSRFDDRHEEQSLTMARILLDECGYDVHEITIIVDDAITYHSCLYGKVPKSLEGKVLATADALAHLTTDFYSKAVTKKTEAGEGQEEIKKWVLKKLERDFHNKILFDEIKNEVQPAYERLKLHYSR